VRLAWEERGTMKVGLMAFGTVLLTFVVITAVLFLVLGKEDAGFETRVALRYATEEGRTVLLEIAPFEPGDNRLRITVLDSDVQPLSTDEAVIRLSRPESADIVSEAMASPVNDGRLEAEIALPETGWWEAEVILSEKESARFYFRLDRGVEPPLEVATPDYESDPEGEALYKRALETYETLTTLRWREQLTSGLLAPTGIGAWVLTTAEAQAPDRLHYQVGSPGASDYETYSVGERSCSKEAGKDWQCSRGSTSDAFDLDYLHPAAFKLGREEIVGGEQSRVLLFYNRSPGAWFAWWVGVETGLLRRQAMVAPGHYMLTDYFDHNAPFTVEVPQEARGPGG